MAIARYGSGKARNTSGTTLTSAADVGSGSDRFLVCGVSAGETSAGDIVTGVTYAGVAMTKVGPAFQLLSPNRRPIYIWYLANPTSGSNNIVVTTSSSNVKELTWAAYDGVSATINGTPASASNTAGPTHTTTITTDVENCWLIRAGFYSRGQTDGANTLTLQQETNTFIFDSNGARASGSNSLITTQSDATVGAHVMIAIAPVGGGATAFRPRVTMY